jgi:hypothetical protein
VLQFLHEADFADGGRRCAFFRVKVDLFESDEFASLSVAALVDGGVGTLTQLRWLAEAQTSVGDTNLFQLLE